MDNRISLTIRDKNALYTSYMPFIKNGGLFIPTNKPYELRQEIFILLTLQLPELRETLPIAGQVVWLSPAGGQSGRRPGIGVQFSDLDRGATKSKIEGQLAGSLESDRPTQTL